MHKTILLSILLYTLCPSAAIAQDTSAASRNKVRAIDHLVINQTVENMFGEP